jgi:RNA polymerase sigma factor (sigma-70 family)
MTLPPFQVLIDRYAVELNRYLVVVAGPGEAADAFQDVMVAALRAYPSLTDDRNLKGWLFTVARHQTIDRYRRTARRPAEVALVTAGGAPAPAHDESFADEAGLWRAVAALPPKQREAVVLRYVADLPYKDIASMVGGTEAAARQNVREALKNLRQEVE